MVSVLLVHEPNWYIEEAIKNKEWFKGIALSRAFFERYGLQILQSLAFHFD